MKNGAGRAGRPESVDGGRRMANKTCARSQEPDLARKWPAYSVTNISRCRGSNAGPLAYASTAVLAQWKKEKEGQVGSDSVWTPDCFSDSDGRRRSWVARGDFVLVVGPLEPETCLWSRRTQSAEEGSGDGVVGKRMRDRNTKYVGGVRETGNRVRILGQGGGKVKQGWDGLDWDSGGDNIPVGSLA